MKGNVIFKLKVSWNVKRPQEVSWRLRIIREKNGIIRSQFWYENDHRWEYFFAPDTETLTDLTEYLKSSYMFHLLQTGGIG